MKQDNFTQVYLKSLNNIIKQDADEKKDVCPECGQDPCVCEEDEELADDQADADAEADVEADDLEVNDEPAQDQKQEQAGTCFCFKTTNQSLIDAIKSGFDKVVFTVKAKDDEGNDTTTDVEFTGDDFIDFDECDCDEQEEEPDDAGDELADDADVTDDEEFGDVEETTFESVFHKYYDNLINEDSNDLSSDIEEGSEEAEDEQIETECGDTDVEGGDDIETECGDVCPECGEKKCTCEAVEEKKDKITKKTVKSAQEVQKLIEKDFGKKSKPWDLKQVKKVAFKNGKLFAASKDGKKWFNKQNKPVEL